MHVFFRIHKSTLAFSYFVFERGLHVFFLVSWVGRNYRTSPATVLIYILISPRPHLYTHADHGTHLFFIKNVNTKKKNLLPDKSYSNHVSWPSSWSVSLPRLAGQVSSSGGLREAAAEAESCSLATPRCLVSR